MEDKKSGQAHVSTLVNLKRHQINCFDVEQNRLDACVHGMHTWCTSDLISNCRLQNIPVSCPVCNGTGSNLIPKNAPKEKKEENEELYPVHRLGIDIGGVIIAKADDSGEDEGNFP